MFNSVARCIGYQQIPCDTAQSLTVPAGTAYVICIPEAQTIRGRQDGTDPTTTVGMPRVINVEFGLAAASLTQFRFIAAVAGGILNVMYFGAT